MLGRSHRRHALLTEVRLQQDERGIAGICPLINEAVELEIGGPRRPPLGLPFGGEEPCAGEDVIQCGAGSKMRPVSCGQAKR